MDFRPSEIVSDKRTDAFALFAAIFASFHHTTVGGTTGGLIGSHMFSYQAPRNSFGAPKVVWLKRTNCAGGYDPE